MFIMDSKFEAVRTNIIIIVIMHTQTDRVNNALHPQTTGRNERNH